MLKPAYSQEHTSLGQKTYSVFAISEKIFWSKAYGSHQLWCIESKKMLSINILLLSVNSSLF